MLEQIAPPNKTIPMNPGMTDSGAFLLSEHKMIENEKEYRKELAKLENLFQFREGNPDIESLLASLKRIEAYENIHNPISPPEPNEAIKFRMERADLKEEDLIPSIGSRKMVFEMLSGNRPVTRNMAFSLNERFGIPIESLLHELNE